MDLVVGIAVVLLGLALGLLAMFLFLPLRLELEATRVDALQFTAALRPFGRFGPRIVVSGGRKTARPEKKRRSGNTRKPSRKKQDPMRIAQAAIRLIVELIRTVRFDAAVLNVRFGLGDPAETGQVYGQITPLLYGTSGFRRVCMTVEPVFDETTLTGRAALDLSLVPARVVTPLMRFGWSAFGPAR